MAQLKEVLDTTYDIRVYTDDTYATLLDDSAAITKDSVMVVENNTFVDKAGNKVKSDAITIADGKITYVVEKGFACAGELCGTTVKNILNLCA